MRIHTAIALAGFALLPACSWLNSTSFMSHNPTLALTQAQIVSDTQGLVSSTQVMIAGIEAANPNAISPAMKTQLAAIGSAVNTSLAQLSATATPAATATNLQVINSYLNTAMSAVSAALAVDPVLNAKYGIMQAAVQALMLGVIEPYVQAVVATGTAPTIAPVTVAPARATLGIPTAP